MGVDSRDGIDTRLKARRAELGLSQEDVARRVREIGGVPFTQQAYAALESGKSRNSIELPAICEALGVNLKWVRDGDAANSAAPAVLARIKSRLDATGLTEAAASDRAGMVDCIRNMRRACEAGREYRFSFETIKRLAPVLETTVDWLLNGDDAPAAAAFAIEADDFARAHLEIRAWRLLEGRPADELRRIIATIEAAFPRNGGGE